MAERGGHIFGLHAAAAVLDRRPARVTMAYVLDGPLNGRLAQIVTRLESTSIPLERAGRRQLDQLSGGGAHQGIVLNVPPPQVYDLNTLEQLVADKDQALRLLILDQIEDPRNLGACLRTADAAGVDAVIVPRARSARLGEAAVKVSAGAAETVPVIAVPNLARTLRWLTEAGVRLVGADERGEKPLFDVPMIPPIALVLGAEGRGLRRLTREHCDQLVRIPMQGAVESLNVSVAAGVMLYEMLRQMR